MNYSISQVGKKFNLQPHTLRYYEKEGIISPQKSPKGIRFYSREDVEQLELLCCLKGTGMSLKDIKRFFDLCKEGDKTLDERMEIFTSHRESILEDLKVLKMHLNKIEGKIKWYQGLIDEKNKTSA